MAIGIGPTSVLSPKLAAKYGRGLVGGAGLLVFGIAFVILGLLDVGSHYWQFAIGLVVFGAGMGLAATPATEAIVESLPLAKQGVASAVNDVSRELGGALGIAILGTL